MDKPCISLSVRIGSKGGMSLFDFEGRKKKKKKMENEIGEFWVKGMRKE